MSNDPFAVPFPEAPWTEPLVLHVHHLTRYNYHDSVRDSFNEARLQPVTDHSQTCRHFFLEVRPAASVRDYPDFHGNSVHYFDVTQPHDRLDVIATSVTGTRPDDRGPPFAAYPLQSLHQNDTIEGYFDFLQDSEFVSIGAEVWKEALDVLPNGVADIWQSTIAIGRHIFATFTYTPSTTTVNTRPAEVVRTRRGVCQDFAHLMLGMCRSQGIPARYVSGYFFNPDRRFGEIEASHAWVEVFLPGYGWKGFDPTHNREPDTRYIKLAVGRDYADIRPVSGTFRGRGTREMVVEVQITRQY